jgi:hypothetical protein
MSEMSQFPQPRLTRKELRLKLHDIVDAMIDRLPIAQDAEAQASGFIDLDALSLEQIRGSTAPDAATPNLNHVLKIEIFPDRKETT